MPPRKTKSDTPRRTRSAKPKVAPSFEIQSSEELLGLPTRKRFNENPLMPIEPAKMLFVGPSGFGKSTIVFNMILKGLLTWDRLYIFSRSIDNYDYVALLDQLEDQCEDKGVEFDDVIFAYESLDDFPDYKDFQSVHNPEAPEEEQVPFKNLVIIDDYGFDSFLKSEEFLTWVSCCRKTNVQFIILAHTFSKFPALVRQQCKQFVFVRSALPGKSAIQLAYENLGDVLELKEFRRLYKTATAKPHNFFYVDLLSEDVSKRFRMGFDQFFSKALFPTDDSDTSDEE